LLDEGYDQSRTGVNEMLGAVLLALLMSATPASHSSSIEGIWRSPGGNSIMKIAPCGKVPCGTIAWASDQAKKASHKTTPHLVGAHLVTGLSHRKDGSWKGKLFIPDQNMHVTAKIRRESHNSLKVSGCAAFICKTQVWTAWSGPLPTDTSRPAPR
jgi:uncharacterized protein (DUF2147 family)